jgi:hypothetical protein
MSRCHVPDPASILGTEDRFKLSGRKLPRAHPDQRSYNAPYHPVQEGVGLDIKREKRASLAPLRPAHRPHSTFSLRRTAERRKVTGTYQRAAGLGHLAQIESVRHVPRSPPLQRRTPRPVENGVPVCPVQRTNRG